MSIEKDAADNWKPSKKRSPERIDGVVALIMATGRAALHDLPTWSCYDDPNYKPEFI